MGELFDAIKQEAAKRPNANKADVRLREHLGEAGWKDLAKAAKDSAITTSTIYRVVKSSGFSISYTSLKRILDELAAS